MFFLPRANKWKTNLRSTVFLFPFSWSWFGWFGFESLPDSVGEIEYAGMGGQVSLEILLGMWREPRVWAQAGCLDLRRVCVPEGVCTDSPTCICLGRRETRNRFSVGSEISLQSATFFQVDNKSFLIHFRYGWYKWGIEVFNSQWVLTYTPFKSVSICLQYLDIPMCVLFSSVTHSCQTVSKPMDCSMPGLPLHRQIPEFTQTHVHWVGDAIKPSHPMSSPSPPAFKLSQHQGLFKWVSSSHQMTKVL